MEGRCNQVGCGIHTVATEPIRRCLIRPTRKAQKRIFRVVPTVLEALGWSSSLEYSATVQKEQIEARRLLLDPVVMTTPSEFNYRKYMFNMISPTSRAAGRHSHCLFPRQVWCLVSEWSTASDNCSPRKRGLRKRTKPSRLFQETLKTGFALLRTLRQCSL